MCGIFHCTLVCAQKTSSVVIYSGTHQILCETRLAEDFRKIQLNSPNFFHQWCFPNNRNRQSQNWSSQCNEWIRGKYIFETKPNIFNINPTYVRQEIWCSHLIISGCIEKLKMCRSIVEKEYYFLIVKNTREYSNRVLP